MSGVSCPFCGSDEVEVISRWGGQMITSQVQCRTCKAYFEAIRDDFGPAVAPAQAASKAASKPGRVPFRAPADDPIRDG